MCLYNKYSYCFIKSYRFCKNNTDSLYYYECFTIFFSSWGKSKQVHEWLAPVVDIWEGLALLNTVQGYWHLEKAGRRSYLEIMLQERFVPTTCNVFDNYLPVVQSSDFLVVNYFSQENKFCIEVVLGTEWFLLFLLILYLFFSRFSVWFERPFCNSGSNGQSSHLCFNEEWGGLDIWCK